MVHNAACTYILMVKRKAKHNNHGKITLMRIKMSEQTFTQQIDKHNGKINAMHDVVRIPIEK